MGISLCGYEVLGVNWKLTKERLLSGRCVDEIAGRKSKNFHNTGELLDFVLAGEQRVARVQFSQDAAWIKESERGNISHVFG